MEVVLECCGGDLAKVAAMGYEAFTARVAAVLRGWGGKRPGGTCRQLFAALADDRGVARYAAGGAAPGPRRAGGPEVRPAPAPRPRPT